jgi:hypothetical protein
MFIATAYCLVLLATSISVADEENLSYLNSLVP